jgi:hypothetical protein
MRGYPYYIEFRVAENGIYGHSYIAYGRLNAFGQPATTTYADIHPTGDIVTMVLGHFIPMDAASTREKDTLDRKIASHFRRPLTAAEYLKLNAIIAQTHAAHHAWSILAYNCNDFVADVARGIACRRRLRCRCPTTSSRGLEAMNEPKPPSVRAPESADPVIATVLTVLTIDSASVLTRMMAPVPPAAMRAGRHPKICWF